MHIQPALQRPVSLRPMPASRPSAPPEEPKDRVEIGVAGLTLRAALGSSLAATRNLAGRFLFGPVGHAIGQALKLVGYKPRPFVLKLPPDALATLPASGLDRPFLLVHGWHHRKELFESLTDKLTQNGANGGRVGFLRNGGLFEDAECTRPLDKPSPDMRVFVSMFETYRDAPDVAAPQLKKNVDFIRALTGQDKVDVAAHSMGGLATRCLVDTEPQHGVGKFMMIGTPNQGVVMASLSQSALEAEQRGYDLRWLLDVKDVQQADTRAMEWLHPKSDLREGMNSRWATGQKSLEAAVVVGSHDKITPSNKLLPTWGDGLIADSSLPLEDTEVRHLSSKGLYSVHGNLLLHPETYANMREFFAWR